MAVEKKEAESQDANEVRLVGRVSGEPVTRTLPSGDEVVVSRLVVGRDLVRARPDGRRGQSVDVIDCAAWSGRTRRSVAGWSEGDTVAVEGALRRRFYRAGGRTAAHVEVEVRSCRVLRRARDG